jgi:hypothetical protein
VNLSPYWGGGHQKNGWNNLFTSDDTDYGNHFLGTLRTIAPMGIPTWQVKNSVQVSCLQGLSGYENHLSWNNQSDGGTQPVLWSISNNAPPVCAGQDEVTMVAIDGSGTMWRFAHMYTRQSDFYAQGMANVSRDGKWAIFTSDWNASGRDDVYLIQLK